MMVFHALLAASIAYCCAATASVAALTSEIDCQALGGECESTRMSGTNGLSLMQSGRSVMPGVNERTADSFDLLDEYFDEITPTVDARSLKSSFAAQVAQVSLPDHFSDPSFYFMVLLYALGFSVVTKLFRQWHSVDVHVVAEHDARRKPESSKSTPPKAEAAPIFALGGSADFDALAEAVRSGDETRCSQLAKTRHAARKEDSCGCTALHIAAQCGSSAMAKILIEHGAKVNAREAWEETPLHIAAREGSAEVCELLLDHGADIDPVNANGRTPLVTAAHAGKEAVCEMLLAKGAGVGNACDDQLPPLLNWLLLQRMFAGAKPQEVSMDDNDGIDEAVYSD